MFIVKDFDKLNSIWDGSLSNSSAVCGACKGMCCHNTEKILFPNEYDYLLLKTGQMNSGWKSVSCLCFELEKLDAKLKPFRPVICKLFPLDINISLTGPVTVNREIPGTDYTDNCSKLEMSDADEIKINKWLEFLFADMHNRFYYLWELQAPQLLDDEKQILRDMGKDPDTMDDSELIGRAMFKAVGIGLKDHYSHFDFNK